MDIHPSPQTNHRAEGQTKTELEKSRQPGRADGVGPRSQVPTRDWQPFPLIRMKEVMGEFRLLQGPWVLASL